MMYCFKYNVNINNASPTGLCTVCKTSKAYSFGQGCFSEMALTRSKSLKSSSSLVPSAPPTFSLTI